MYTRCENPGDFFESKSTTNTIVDICNQVNGLLEKQMSEYSTQSTRDLETTLEEIAYALLSLNQFENIASDTSEAGKQPKVILGETVEKLIDHLLGSMIYSRTWYPRICNFFTEILGINGVTSCLMEYKNKEGRNLAMLILIQSRAASDLFLSDFIRKWFQKNKKNLRDCDNFSYSLADYLLCHSFNLYQDFLSGSENNLVCSHPISKKLSQVLNRSIDSINIREVMQVNNIDAAKLGMVVAPRFIKLLTTDQVNVIDYKKLLQFASKVINTQLTESDFNALKSVLPKLSIADTDELLSYVLAPSAGDIELLLFGTVLSLCDEKLKEHIIAAIVSQGEAAKAFFEHFCKGSRAPCVSNNLKIMINALLPYVNFPKYHRLNNLLTNPAALCQIDDIDEILAVQSDNDVNHIELFLLNILVNRASEEVIDYSLQLILTQHSFFANNVLRIMLMGLNENVLYNCSEIYRAYLKLGFARKVKFNFNINREDRLPMARTLKHLFHEVHANRKRKLENLESSSDCLERFDEKERLTQSVLVLQGWMSSKVRTKTHTRHYYSASRQTETFSPKKMDKLLLTKIKKLSQELDFIYSVTHVTNYCYLRELLDQGVFSRDALTRYAMPYIGAALNEDVEGVDIDTVCFAVGDTGDVDSAALKNATSTDFPVRLTLNFHTLRKLRHFVKGQVFIKEHDLFWSTKPDSEEKRSSHGTKRDHEEFATCDIPQEFSEVITLGQKQFTFYRNVCGIKFIVDNCKYVLHYPYWNDLGGTIYEGQSDEKKAQFNIQEEVIENNFGETLFYGDIKKAEQFFVMQFFRHIEKLPQLREILYNELNNISNEELLAFLNQVGKKLTCGAEINFQRCFYMPMECLTQVEMLSNFDKIQNSKVYSVHYGCNHFFQQAAYGPRVINIMALLEVIKEDQVELFDSFKAQCPMLFKSIRFVRYLLKESSPGSAIEALIAREFNKLFENLAKEDNDTAESSSKPFLDKI